MFRLVVFRDGGIVEFEKNAAAVPTSVLNELIVRECIDNSRKSNQAQIRLGRKREYAARLSRNPETATNVALLYPAAVKVVDDPELLVNDIAKIFAKYESDPEKFAALVDIRIQKSTINPESNSEHDDNEVHEPEEPPVNAAAKAAATTAASKAPTAAMGNEKTSSKKSKKTKQSKAGTTTTKKKKKRTWDGGVSDSDEDGVLDYSESSAADGAGSAAPVTQLDALDLGKKSRDGFLVKELSDELDGVLRQPDSTTSGNATTAASQPLGFLKRYVGGKKLDENDLKNVLAAMEDHLVRKNVAKEVAASICESVGKDLIGTETRSWTSVSATVRESMKRTLSRILTPSSSTDLLAAIREQKRSGRGRPYVVSVVGVNGVGKSTNLGKLGFWFLQNDFRVMVAACDTFRSGAVEQLQVHVNRLQQLKGRSNGDIELFDQGYGKDAAVIAKAAVDKAERTGFDVVLIDTAGRRHNDDRLMSSLEKFGNYAQPNKIIMVGEALVGSDSVEQAKNFDAAFGHSRGIDFFLISKCDTVGEMLGTLVNVTYSTGVPVLFVGVGQQYTDLRTLSVDWAVDKLLS